MTAMNVILGSTKAFVLSDSVMYRSNGVIDSFGLKTVVATGGAAIAVRGDYRLAPALAEAFEDAYSSIDDVMIDECRNLCERYDQTVEEFGDGTPAHAQFTITGWSEDEGKPIGVIVTLDDEGWSFSRIDGGLCAPLPGATELSQLGLLGLAPGEDWQPDDFDPMKHGVPMLEAQRRMKLTISPTSGKVHAVGGDVTLTTVTEDGITQEVIHRWDDQIGSRIEAASFVRPVVEGMNRQQRRAIERANRQAPTRQARRA